MKSNPEINKDVMSHVNHETHSRVLLARMRKFFGTMTKADVGKYFDKYLKTGIEEYYQSGENPERGDKRNPGYALWKRNTSRYRYDLTMMAKDGKPDKTRKPSANHTDRPDVTYDPNKVIVPIPNGGPDDWDDFRTSLISLLTQMNQEGIVEGLNVAVVAINKGRRSDRLLPFALVKGGKS